MMEFWIHQRASYRWRKWNLCMLRINFKYEYVESRQDIKQQVRRLTGLR